MPESMSHDAALDAIIGCAATVTVLSYEEAIGAYFKLRGWPDPAESSDQGGAMKRHSAPATDDPEMTTPPAPSFEGGEELMDSRDLKQEVGVKVLTDLLARVEAAEGPDRELDALLFLACGLDAAAGSAMSGDGVDGRFRFREGEMLSALVARYPRHIALAATVCQPPHVTASLDCALALVERVLPGWCIENMGEMSPDCGAQAGFWLVQLRPRLPRRRMVGAITAENLRGTFDALDPVSHKNRPIALLIALIKALIARDFAGHGTATHRATEDTPQPEPSNTPEGQP